MGRTFACLGIGAVVLLGMGSSPARVAAKEPASLTQKLTCTITKIRGSFGSFAPPRVGHKVVVDPALPRIARLTTSGGYIPAHGPLVRQPSTRWSRHRAVYRSVYTTPDGDLRHVQLMVGKFSNGYTGRIQKLVRENHDGLYTLAEIELTCRPSR